MATDYKQGFKAPEGYFESFGDRLKDRMNQEITKLPKTDGFKEPEGYLDTLDAKILAAVKEEETKLIRLPWYRNYYTAVAAVAAIFLIAIGLQFNGSSKAVTFDQLLSDLSDTDIETYFENNDLELSSYEIAEVLPVDELELDAVLEKGFSETNLFEYLDNTIEDFDDLNLEDDE